MQNEVFTEKVLWQLENKRPEKTTNSPLCFLKHTAFKILLRAVALIIVVTPRWKILPIYRVVFYTGPPPKSSKYEKVNLG